jgi:4-amino-4-deoxy-L-arabinose transferase-like glycosyltransferase
MRERQYTIAAGALVLLMLILAALSMRGDALTTDESPHIAAGYSYLTTRDMRLNPEHPPLIKDIAALPLLFQDVRAPTDHASWTEDVNGQWGFGSVFFFGAGNNPDDIMRGSRIAMLLFLALIGIYLFRWAKERYGGRAALFALALFVFSPTFLAHGRLVTTDTGATFGFLIGLYYFVKFMNSPSRGNAIKAGIAFGVAQLLKFSLVLLVPTYAILFIVWWAFEIKTNWKLLGRYALGLAALFVVGYAILFPVYQFHISN